MSHLLDFIASAPDFPEAKCADIEDPDIFFEDDVRKMRARAVELREICISCVHRIECMEYAVNERIEFGFWGGTTPEERKRLQPAKKMGRKRSSRKGQQAARMRALGMRWVDIGDELRMSAQAAEKAYRSYMNEQRKSQ